MIAPAVSEESKKKKPEPPPEDPAKLALRQIRSDVARIFVAWDPMSLRGLRGFEKEYDPWIGPAAIMVKKRLPAADIAAYLDRVVQTEMRLPPCRAKCLEVATKMHRAGAILDTPATPPKD